MARKKKKRNLGKYKSGFEKKFGQFLKKVGVQFLYEKVKLPYIVPAKNKTYTPDFIYDPKNKKRIKNSLTLDELKGKIIIETKGRLTLADRQKMLYVKEAHPDLDIRFVFMQDNPIRKNSNTRYSDWCEQHGFLYHFDPEGSVPKEWLR